MLISIILILFLGSTLIQILTWTLLFPISLQTKAIQRQSEAFIPSVSVVICAKNEWSNIQENLPQILAQQYPNFEVILIDDHSDENLEILMKPWISKWEQLKVCRNRNAPGKKGALQTGLDLAKNEIILLTDADCCPASMNWIAWMVSAFNNSTSIVIGYSPFERESGWLNAFIRYESTINMLQYTSLCSIGFPYMGVGRNLAYRKSILTSGILNRNKDLLWGDDDLMVNILANSHTTSVMLHPASHVKTKAENNLLTFFHQKRRHVSTSWRYRASHKIILGSFALSMWFHMVLVIPVLLAGFVLLPVLLYFIRFGICLHVVKKLLSGSVHTDLLPKLIVLELFLSVYYPIVAFMLLKKKPEYW